jgi:DNA-directed RNA polymerase subunit RPC12/RpoP
MPKIEKRIRKCTRCKHEWAKRANGPEPKKCPNCNSPYWNKKRTRPATVRAIQPKEVA